MFFKYLNNHHYHHHHHHYHHYHQYPHSHLISLQQPITIGQLHRKHKHYRTLGVGGGGHPQLSGLDIIMSLILPAKAMANSTQVVTPPSALKAAAASVLAKVGHPVTRGVGGDGGGSGVSRDNLSAVSAFLSGMKAYVKPANYQPLEKNQRVSE